MMGRRWRSRRTRTSGERRWKTYDFLMMSLWSWIVSCMARSRGRSCRFALYVSTTVAVVYLLLSVFCNYDYDTDGE